MASKSQQAQADFLKAMKTTGGKAWNSTRRTRDPFAPLNVPEGTYTCKLTDVVLGKNKKKNYPQLCFRMRIVDPAEYSSRQPQVWHFINATKKRTVDDALERMFQDFQRLGFETDEWDMADIIPAVEQLKKDQPIVKITVTDGQGGGQFINLVGLSEDDDEDYVDDDAPSEEVPPEDDDDDDAGDDNDENVDDPDDDAEGDDDADESPAAEEVIWKKGAECDYKPPRHKNARPCTIIKCSSKTKLVTLKDDENDKEYVDIPWDKLLVPVYEDE